MKKELTNHISSKLMGYRGGEIDVKTIAKSARAFTYVFSVLQEAVTEISDYIENENVGTYKSEEDVYKIINESIKDLQKNTEFGDLLSYEMVLMPKKIGKNNLCN